MNAEPSFLTELRRELANPQAGVIGLADLVSKLCSEFGLEIDWTYDRLCVRTPDHGTYDFQKPLLRRSVFRAVLARLATLSRESLQQPVSPYGGEGLVDLVLAGNHLKNGAAVHMKFVNTADEQQVWMWKAPIGDCPPELSTTTNLNRSESSL